MNTSLGIARSGMQAFQDRVDALAHDIANVNTTAYKSAQTSFEKLLDNDVAAGAALRLNDTLPSVTVGTGVRNDDAGLSMEQGALMESEGSFQLALTGDGFFRVRDGQGQEFLTRDGNFHQNPDGSITNTNGDRLLIQWANGAPATGEGSFVVRGNGEVYLSGNGPAVFAGTIPLYRVADATTLQPSGENKYVLPAQAQLLPAGKDVQIQQQMLESSNVDLADRITQLMVAQRAYSLNLKAAQTSDETMGIINQFKQ